VAHQQHVIQCLANLLGGGSGDDAVVIDAAVLLISTSTRTGGTKALRESVPPTVYKNCGVVVVSA